MTIKALFVDDEYLALNLLETYAKQLPDIEIMDKVKSPVKALEILSHQPIDLLFLDIQMPILSGNNLLKTLQNPPVTIFTTAYSEFALEAFDLNAVDYLLKPYSFERFLQAVNKARELLLKASISKTTTSVPPAKSFFSAKVNGKIQKIFYQDILFIEGLKEYVRIVCPEKRYVILESLKRLEQTLPADQFIRVHKSFIVAKGQVQSLNGMLLEIGSHKIPISRGKKEEIVQAIFHQP